MRICTTNQLKLKIGKFLSRSFNINKDIEQGHPMSPDLFKLFILDLSEQFNVQGSYPELCNATVNHPFEQTIWYYSASTKLVYKNTSTSYISFVRHGA